MNAIMIAGTFGHGATLGSMSGDEILCAAFLAVAGTFLLAAGALLSRHSGTTRLHAVHYVRNHPRR